MSYSDEVLTGLLGKRCHPLNFIDMFTAALGGKVHIKNKTKESFYSS